MSTADPVTPASPATAAPSAAAGTASAGIRPFLRLLGSEIGLVYRRRRTWALHAALALIPVLVAVAVRVTTHEPPAGRGPQFLGDITHNGFFVALTGLAVAIPIFLPMTVAVVAGDSIAGEASHGTLRYLLAAPTGRARLLVVKYISVVVFCVSGPLAVAAAGAAAGAALFPVGPVPLLSGDTVSYGAAMVRLALIALYLALSLLGLAAIGLFISTLTNSPVGAMASVVVVTVVAQVMDVVPQLDWLHPWLFDNLWLSFADLLREPIVWTSFGQNALLQLGYVVVFGALAYGRFASRDVLS